MENIRLKTALHPKQVENRMKYRPEIVELHLNEEDLYQPEDIISVIKVFQSKGTTVYLHHPAKYKGKYLDIISSDKEMRDYYDWSCRELVMICQQEKVKCVVHCHYAQSESSYYNDHSTRVQLRKRLEGILPICEDSFLWEDTIKGIFSAQNPYLFQEIIEPLNLPLNIDVSHSFIALRGDNDRLKRHLDSAHPFARYYHLVDSNGEYHDALPLGKGKIDWNMVKSYVQDTDFIFEIDLKAFDYLDCTPMIESARYYNKLDAEIGRDLANKSLKR
jgi:sugar phosphate isomerase/epimerase